MTGWRIPPRVLPTLDESPLWVRDGTITTTPVPDAPPLPGRFALPGLVDAHAHVALGDDVQLGLDDALAMLRTCAAQGVLLVRDMGCPDAVTLRLPQDPELPRLIACGEQLVSEAFFPGLTPVPPGQLVEAARAQIEAGATWVKILSDWITRGLLFPIEEIRAVVDFAHRAGVRVAVHSLWEDVAQVVETGVDSIEHGTLMDEATLREMARRGTAWAPTSNADYTDEMEALLEDPNLEAARRTRIMAFLPSSRLWRDTSARMIPKAYELGVTVLASTDREGTVADEVDRFVRYGVDPVEAVKSATTTSRAFLGAPGLEEAAPADVVTFDDDPLTDPSVLHRPVAILLGGVRLR